MQFVSVALSLSPVYLTPYSSDVAAKSDKYTRSFHVFMIKAILLQHDASANAISTRSSFCLGSIDAVAPDFSHQSVVRIINLKASERARLKKGYLPEKGLA